MSTEQKTEISMEELQYRMRITPHRKITNICAHWIYDGYCNKSCNRIHTQSKTKICIWLRNANFKKYVCSDGASCKHFLCMRKHSHDDQILGYGFSTDLEYTCNGEKREEARVEWKKEKTEVYNEELRTGVRRPKNEKEKLIANTKEEEDHIGELDYVTEMLKELE
jgi:hypothetical protein